MRNNRIRINIFRLLIALSSIAMPLFLLRTNDSYGAETEEEYSWSASYTHTSDQLQFSIEVSIDRPDNGMFFQVSKDGALKESVHYQITVKNDSDQSLGYSCKFRSGKKGEFTYAAKGICSEEEKSSSYSFVRFFPEDHLTESVVGKNKEDYPDTWIYTDHLSFHVWLKDEEENENTSYSGKLEIELPLGWQTVESKESSDAGSIREIAAEDDQETLPIVIHTQEASEEETDSNRTRRGLMIAGAAAAVLVIGVCIILIINRGRRKRNEA